MTSMDSFVGKYERVHEENYENFLKALDVNYLTRKATSFVSPHPHLELYKEGNMYVMKISTTFKSIECKFEIGKPFDTTTDDGREVCATVLHEGNKLIAIHKAKKEGEKSTKTVREFTGDEILQTTTIDGVENLVCFEKFKRIC